MATGNNSWSPDDDDDVDPNEGQNQQTQGKPSGGLRAHAEQVKRENAELKAALEKLETERRTENVKSAITAKGYDPQIADLVPKEIASDKAELDKWLKERAGLFKTVGKKNVDGDEGEPVDEGEPEDDLDSEELSDDADAWGRISRVSSSGLPPSKQGDTLAAIHNAKDRKEMDAVLRKFGNKNVNF